MLQKFIKIIGGDPHKKEIDRLSEIVRQVNALETEFEALSDDGLRAKTEEFRQHIADQLSGFEDEKERQKAEQDALAEILPRAFAAVREASKRTIGLRHYDVQLIGGMTLHYGKIAEMRTGEGKTLVATLPLYLNALTGRGVHLVTVNDYLARRDARWMFPIYNTLGLTVGVLQMASRTENGQNAFVVDPGKTSPHEDQHHLRLVPRHDAYQADIVYGTNSEFGFDYLRDNLTNSLGERSQRGHYYAIVDEVDNILIDEARTPLIISGPASEDTAWYARTAMVARQLRPEDYEVNEKDRAVSLTEVGEAHVEELLELPLRDPERPEDVTPEQARILGYLEQALRAQFLYRRNKDYLVQAGKVVIVDEFTGRLMPGRRWSDGLHQAVEAKEGVKVEPENVTYATITIQNYFRMYQKLAGMTGTALTEAEEFAKIYKLEVLPIPTNLEFVSTQNNAPLAEISDKDAQGYRYQYYARRDDTAKKPVYWRRKDYPDVVFRTEEAKIRAITLEIIRYHILGRPQLVGTTSVEHSERLSDRLASEPVRRLLQVSLIRHTYLEKRNIQMPERGIAELQPLNTPIPNLEVSLLRNLARTLELNVSMNPEDPENLKRLLAILELGDEDIPRLVKALQGGIQHQVLNARKHDEESMIIARAGAFGAVTIATNMAGRGVDIKLGGELPEDVVADVVRVLSAAGIPDPYEMNNEQRRQALLKLTPDQYGIYEEQVKAFLQYWLDMERVRELGGLHVIGSERHEARRIDNQLRGRSARQGDPGSSRFYLSLEDELMRLFGGGQAEGLFKRLNVEESLPIESGILGRLVEQSQERVEGANFDVRKHLLEYDDVLNAQRKRIYEQRDRVFTKEDLSDDVLEMLRTELQERIPEALKDEEGPWKLLAYLEEIQPLIEFDELLYPSYTLQLILNDVKRALPASGTPTNRVRTALLEMAGRAFEAERDHLLRSARDLLEKSEETLASARSERIDALDAYFEGLKEPAEEGTPPRRPLELLDELSTLTHLPLKLTPDLLRQLPSGEEAVKDALAEQVNASLQITHASRIVGALERRLEESLGLKLTSLQNLSWDEAGGQILEAFEQALARRAERLLGGSGQIARDLAPILERLGDSALEERSLIQLTRLVAQGSRLEFDRRTHQQNWRRFLRLSYPYLAARLLEGESAQNATADILEHLEKARETLQFAWGKVEWNRLALGEVTLDQLDQRMQEHIIELTGAERFAQLKQQPLLGFSPEEREQVTSVLGWRLQNEIYRQILLGVISEQWVDYLTKVEALRVSIGLEAYAQRNPLVEYKGKASELFRALLRDVRQGAISRMFTTQPRRGSEASVEQRSADASEPEAAADNPPPSSADQPRAQLQDQNKKKRRRH